MLTARAAGFLPLLHPPRFFSLTLTCASSSDPLNMSESADRPTSPPRKLDVKYDLCRGHPNAGALPFAEMKSIMSDLIREDEDEYNSWGKYLNYGDNAGDERLRAAIRSFLDRRTEDDYAGKEETMTANDIPTPLGTESELFVTDGVSHGLELLCASLTSPGDEVWVERPTYFLATGIFESRGLVVRSLPMMSDRSTGEGDYIGRVDIDQLIDMVEGGGISPPRMIYVIPSYHNPTGRSMTVDERRRLASFAIRNGVYLVADEVYHLLDWGQGSNGESRLLNDTDGISRRPPGIVHFNNLMPNESNAIGSNKVETGCCISVSSFTKIWAPGVRLGWIDAPSFICMRLKRYGYINSQGGVAPFMGRMMTHGLESNLVDDFLDKLRQEYTQRYELVYNILMDEPRIAVLTENSPVRRRGGYFIWVRFPLHVDSHHFLSYSLEKFGVKFMAGGRCDPFPLAEEDASGRAIRSCARLCFADLDRDELASATLEFIVAFRSYMKCI